jgi:hypothetical protein
MFSQPGSAQQGYPPAPNYPGQMGSPAPKKRTGLIIGIVAIVCVLLLCALGACAIGLGALSNKGAETDAVTLAEQHFNAAMKDVESASASIKKASNGSQSEVTAAITDATKKLRDGRDEIAKATVPVERMKVSAGRTDYLSGLKAATDTLDALQDMVAYMGTANGMAAKALEAANLTKAANKSRDGAVDSGNSSRYTAMRTQAVSASTNYTKAEVLFREAHALDPSAGFDKAAAYAQKRRLEADVIVRMAEEGKAGRLKAYNADIKKQKSLSRQAMAAGSPAIVSDPNWAANRLADLSDKIDAAAKRADTLRAKALKELGVTK